MKSRRSFFRRREAQRLLMLMGLLLGVVHLSACQQNPPNDPQLSPSTLSTDETDENKDASSVAMVSTALPDSDQRKGEKVWTDNCISCHGTGRAGAPKIGEKSQWAPRITQGVDVLIGHALNGFYGKGGAEMPARGGNPALSDEDIKVAVVYMVAQSR